MAETEEVKFCKICLNTGVKLFHEDEFHLQVLYEQLFDEAIYFGSINNYYCYECTIYLWKFNVFRRKCLNAQNAVGSLIQSGPITNSIITSIDREKLKLTSSLVVVPTLVVSMKEDINAINKNNPNIEKLGNPINATSSNSGLQIDPIIIIDDSDDEESNKHLVKEHDSKEQTASRDIIMKDQSTNIDLDLINQNTSNAVKTIKDSATNNFSSLNVFEELTEFCRLPSDHDFIDENNDTCDDDVDDGKISIEIEETALTKTKLPESPEISNLVNKGNNDITSKPAAPKVFKKESVRKNTKKSKKAITEKVKFARQNKKAYKFDDSKWKITYLSAEEAVRKHNKRRENPNYQASEFKCQTCIKVFLSEDTLKRHMTLHSPSRGKEVCSLCERRYRIKAFLNLHFKTHLTVYQCLRCDEVFNYSMRARWHDLVHDGVSYECKYCNTKFTNKQTYYTHIRVSHRSEHLCSLCGASFVTRRGVSQHMQMIHDKEREEKRDEADTEMLKPEEPIADVREEPNTSLGKEHYCEKCDIAFKSIEAFETHKNNSAKHNEDYEYSGQERNLKPGKSGQRRLRAKRTELTCKYCQEIFPSKRERGLHILRKHRALTQNKGHRVICDVCGASLAYKSMYLHMRAHRNRPHARPPVTDTDFSCDQCHKKLSSAWNKMQHMITHTGEKPYSCKLCEKRFTQPQSLRKHLRICH